jgi:hypothetical protein
VDVSSTRGTACDGNPTGDFPRVVGQHLSEGRAVPISASLARYGDMGSVREPKSRS